MTILVPIVTFGSILIFFTLFAFLPKRRALLISMIGAWLFLPVIPDKAYDIENLPEFTKLFVISAGIFLAVTVLDFKRLRNFRPHWFDIPMLIWCLVPIASSVSNCMLEGVNLTACLNPFATTTFATLGYDLGLYDGLSEAFAQSVQWGIPYLLGRLYITDLESVRDLATGILMSIFAYLPFLLYEMRMSPQLHNLIYGYHQHLFHQTYRFGGWRPMVFMNHGLMVAFWVMSSALLAVWMWRAGTIKKLKLPWLILPALGILAGILAYLPANSPTTNNIDTVPVTASPILTTVTLIILTISIIMVVWLWRTEKLRQSFAVPFWIIAVGLVVLTILMRSVNGWAWLTLGIVTLFATEYLRTRWIVIALLVMIPMYTFTNSLSMWPTELSIDFMTGLFGSERAQSLEYRYFNEAYLTERARQHWMFGWAGWDRQLVTFEWTDNKTVPDSLWIIVLGKFGLVGLISLLSAMLMPTILLLRKYPPWLWAHEKVAPLAVMSIVMALYMLDGLLNTMINPVYMLAAGGLLSAYITIRQSQEAQISAQRYQQPMPASSTVNV